VLENWNTSTSGFGRSFFHVLLQRASEHLAFTAEQARIMSPVLLQINDQLDRRQQAK
jgi:hypothetical protein